MKLAPGLCACLVLAIAASLLGAWFPIVGGPVFAILGGVAIATWRPPSSSLVPGISFASKTLLQWSIVLLGFHLSLAEIVRGGERFAAGDARDAPRRARAGLRCRTMARDRPRPAAAARDRHGDLRRLGDCRARERRRRRSLRRQLTRWPRYFSSTSSRCWRFRRSAMRWNFRNRPSACGPGPRSTTRRRSSPRHSPTDRSRETPRSS